MPIENVPTAPEYHDDDVLLSVEPPTASRPTLILIAAGVGVRAAVELTLTAAGELASMLRTVAVATTAGADFIGEDDQN